MSDNTAVDATTPCKFCGVRYSAHNMHRHTSQCSKNGETNLCEICNRYVAIQLMETHMLHHVMQRDEREMRKATIAARKASDKAKLLQMEADCLHEKLLADNKMI